MYLKTTIRQFMVHCFWQVWKEINPSAFLSLLYHPFLPNKVGENNARDTMVALYRAKRPLTEILQPVFGLQSLQIIVLGGDIYVSPSPLFESFKTYIHGFQGRVHPTGTTNFVSSLCNYCAIVLSFPGYTTVWNLYPEFRQSWIWRS